MSCAFCRTTWVRNALVGCWRQNSVDPAYPCIGPGEARGFARHDPPSHFNLREKKKTTDEKWAKTLYRRAVRRCHPDTLKVADDDYKEELTGIYQNITESYENNNLDILMVETYKLFIKPKEVIDDQIEILEESKQTYYKNIQNILSSQGFVWSTFNDEMKENFLINLMKQRGVKFVDKQKVNF